MKIARVFPRRTNATPVDDLAFVGNPGLFPPEVDEVHISVTFTWDIPVAERLKKEWKDVAPVKLGGPALGDSGKEFIPGMYLKPGYLITSRGCPNKCWFCDVPRREGRSVRELPIMQGHNILDSNLLACSRKHIESVFEMLSKQKMGRILFTGGLEAARLRTWHIKALRKLKPQRMYFAYDTAGDLKHLVRVAPMLGKAGFTRHHLYCYVLIGWRGDTFKEAEKRFRRVMELGMCPIAMYYRDKTSKKPHDWGKFQTKWSRPAIIYSNKTDADYEMFGDQAAIHEMMGLDDIGCK